MKRAISKKSRIAKIAGIVVALTIAVVTVVALALPGAAALATTYNVKPSQLPTADYFGGYTADVISDGGSVTWPAETQNKMYSVKVGENATVASNGNFAWDNNYEGIMFYYDFSQSGLAETVGVSLAVTVDGVEYYVLQNNTKFTDIMYCLDGSDEWTKYSAVKDNTYHVPATSKGWYYMPAYAFYATASNTSVAGTEDGISLAEVSGNLSQIKVILNAGTASEALVYLDNFCAVKRYTPIGLPAAVPNTSVSDTTPFTLELLETFNADDHRYSSVRTSEQGTVSDDRLVINYKSKANAQGGVNYTMVDGKLDAGLAKIDKGSKGVIFYVDASSAVSNGQKYNEKEIVAFELYFETPLYSNALLSMDNVRATGNVGYAYDVKNETWSETKGVNGGRMAVPSGFVGYIYIPFSSYTLGSTSNSLADVLENYNVYVTNLRVYSNYVKVNADTNVYIDDIAVVKESSNVLVESSAPTTLPNGQTIASTQTVIDFSSDYYGIITSASGSNKANETITDIGYAINNPDRSGYSIVTDSTGNNAGVFHDPVTGKNVQNLIYVDEDGVSVSGKTGLMYYINLTDLKGLDNAMYSGYDKTNDKLYDGTAETTYMAVGLRLFTIADNKMVVYNANNLPAYYYMDGEWYKTNSVNGNRYLFPEEFEGYVYMPLEYYTDGKNNLSNASFNFFGVYVLTEGIALNTEDINARNELIIDDISFISATGSVKENADSIPNLPDYIVGGATGNASYISTTLIDFEGTQGIYADSKTSASAYASWKGAEMYLKTDSATNDTEFVIDISSVDGGGYAKLSKYSSKDILSAVKNNDGIMFHLDIKGMTINGNKEFSYTYDGEEYDLSKRVGFTPTLSMSDGKNYVVGYGAEHQNPVFYYSDNGNAWDVTTSHPVSSGTIALPEDFSGWIYIPFSSLIDKSSKASLIDCVAELETFTLDSFSCVSAYNKPIATEAAQFVLDDFRIVDITTERPLDGSATAVANAEAIANNMIMTDGANIRVGTNGTGIRFFTTITKNDAYRAAFPNGYGADCETNAIKFGTLLIPAKLLGDDDFTIDNANVLDIPAKKVWSDDEDKMVYTAVLTDIPFSWYDEKIVAISYIVYGTGYNVDGTIDGTYIYIGMDGKNATPVSRSYQEVAIAAYAGGNTDAEIKKVATAPAVLPDGEAIGGYKLVTDFDNNFNIDAYADNTNYGYGEITDNGFKITTYGEATGGFAANSKKTPWSGIMALENTVDVTGYNGLIYYVDTTGLSGASYNHDNDSNTPNRIAVSVMLRLSANENGTSDTEAVSRAEFNKKFFDGENLRTGAAYYYENGAWVATTPTDNFETPAAATYGKGQYFMSLPEDYVGYVYVPFETYNVGDKDWATFTATNKYLSRIQLRTNQFSEYGSVVFDDLYIVK